jgi:hypothetical protein
MPWEKILVEEMGKKEFKSLDEEIGKVHVDKIFFRGRPEPDGDKQGEETDGAGKIFLVLGKGIGGIHTILHQFDVVIIGEHTVRGVDCCGVKAFHEKKDHILWSFGPAYILPINEKDFVRIFALWFVKDIGRLDVPVTQGQEGSLAQVGLDMIKMTDSVLNNG